MLFETSMQMTAVAIALVAAVIDHKSGRIPNWLTLPALPIALLTHGFCLGRFGALSSLVGLVLAALVPWFMHRASAGRAIGGGDVKLFAALGALTGPSLGLELELTSFVVVCFYAMLKLAFRGQLLALLRRALQLMANPILPARWRRPLVSSQLIRVRMGPAIFASSLICAASAHVTSWWV